MRNDPIEISIEQDRSRFLLEKTLSQLFVDAEYTEKEKKSFAKKWQSERLKQSDELHLYNSRNLPGTELVLERFTPNEILIQFKGPQEILTLTFWHNFGHPGVKNQLRKLTDLFIPDNDYETLVTKAKRLRVENNKQEDTSKNSVASNTKNKGMLEKSKSHKQITRENEIFSVLNLLQKLFSINKRQLFLNFFGNKEGLKNLFNNAFLNPDKIAVSFNCQKNEITESEEYKNFINKYPIEEIKKRNQISKKFKGCTDAFLEEKVQIWLQNKLNTSELNRKKKR